MTHLSASEKSDLKALREADLALYMLWKRSEVNSPLCHAINEIQAKHIHPAIEKLERACSER